MKTSLGWLATRAAPVLGAALIALAWASGAGVAASGDAGGAPALSGQTAGPDAAPDGGGTRGAAGPVTVFVDARDGDDACTGRARCRAAGAPDDGPKKSLAAGLAALAGGGLLVVTGGAFDGGLDVRGRAVDVRIDGEVALGRRAAPCRDGAEERAP